MPRHRIIEKRGPEADGWLRALDRADSPAAFLRSIVIEQAHFYGTAPQPRGEVMIPRAAVTDEYEIEGRRLSLTVCREPMFFLLEEVWE